MSISKAYNHKTGVYYAYETTYQWSEEQQKNVAVRKCIGHFDMNTGEIVPNGQRGRKPIYPRKEPALQDNTTDNEPTSINDFEYLAGLYRKLTDIYASAAAHFEVENRQSNNEKSKGISHN